MEILNETELIEEAMRGSSGVFEALVERHDNLVYRTAYRFYGVREDAEDIAQEVFNNRGQRFFKLTLFGV